MTRRWAIWRKPSIDTEDYPGLFVSDNCVSGSIRAGHTRLPLWCLTSDLCEGGFKQIEADRYIDDTGLTQESLSAFLHHILDHRGEFARLICVLADVERREQEAANKGADWAWWEKPRYRNRVLKALRNCVEALEEIGK